MLSPLASARALLEPALEPDDTWEEVVRRLHEKTAQLWFSRDGRAAMVTELFGDCIHVWLGGGHLRSLLDLRPSVEATARYWGMTKATIAGRPGWDRALRRCGYVRKGDELEKLL